MSPRCSATNSPSPATVDPVVAEFEAAEVLASLAQDTVGDGAAVDSVDSRESKGKRLCVVESEVNSAAAAITVVEKKPKFLIIDLNEDQPITSEQDEESQRRSNQQLKPETDELADPDPVCTASHSGGKPGQNLTEAEKEARRQRRVLANRESARQTIQRRKARYEELARRVADLVQEHENLKREKVSAAQCYRSLKCANKKLKEQVSKQSGPKQEEDQKKSTASNCSIPTPFANYPYITYSNMQESMGSESRKEKGQPSSIDGSGRHWCTVPYPLFFPMPDAKSGPNLMPFIHTGDKKGGTCVNNQHGESSSQAAPFIDVEKEPECTKVESVANSEAVLLKEGHGFGDGVSPQEPFMSPQEPFKGLGKRHVDSKAAAEARKRRKELTRQKSTCGTPRKAGIGLGESRL